MEAELGIIYSEATSAIHASRYKKRIDVEAPSELEQAGQLEP
jgi:hypothetical protein